MCLCTSVSIYTAITSPARPAGVSGGFNIGIKITSGRWSTADLFGLRLISPHWTVTSNSCLCFCLSGGQVVQFRLASCGQDSHLKIWAINKFSSGGGVTYLYILGYLSLSFFLYLMWSPLSLSRPLVDISWDCKPELSMYTVPVLQTSYVDLSKGHKRQNLTATLLYVRCHYRLSSG